MFGQTDIECHACGKICGRTYPATHSDPGFSEGPGEDFVDDQYRWHCSEDCYQQTNSPHCDNCGVVATVERTVEGTIEHYCAECAEETAHV